MLVVVVPFRGPLLVLLLNLFAFFEEFLNVLVVDSGSSCTYMTCFLLEITCFRACGLVWSKFKGLGLEVFLVWG